MSNYLLAIDQGTTSSRAIIFTHTAQPISQHQIDLTQYYPSVGWVEQDAEEIWKNTLICCQQALKKANLSAHNIAAVGITNQRETTILWDKRTGEPINRAIVWQDRRTNELCKQLKHYPIESQLQEKTGLLLDPYFSATKITWLLDTLPKARKRAEQGDLIFGTVDTFLLWHLTKGKVHATDATNASRTLLFNIRTQQWDDDILSMFNIPKIMLPVVKNSSDYFGNIDSEFLGSTIPITSLIGDQQAATVGQACFSPGMVKSTYGTGCFMLLNTGEKIIQSKNQLLSTIAYRINNVVTYGLEGSIFSAGVTIKWLRDNLKIIKTTDEIETFVKSVNDNGGVHFVPAFTGLGAPYWNSEAKAALLGLTRDSSIGHIVRAALEAVAYQTRDLLDAMISDSQTKLTVLRVDGGMVANNWLLQFLSDILNLAIHRPTCIETTALGAAYLAGLQVGMYQSLDEISHLCDTQKIFLPTMSKQQPELLYQDWKKAVARVL